MHFLNERKATYLGDGLYVAYDGYQFILAASNGNNWTDTVYLDPGVMQAFKAFASMASQSQDDQEKPEPTESNTQTT